MTGKLASWSIRLVVATGVYAIVAYFWFEQARGWDRLGVLVSGMVFGCAALAAWFMAIALAQFVGNATVRLVLHPLLTVVLLLALSAIFVGGFMGMTWDALWRDLRPFALLVAGASAADAAIGLLLAQRNKADTGQAV